MSAILTGVIAGDAKANEIALERYPELPFGAETLQEYKNEMGNAPILMPGSYYSWLKLKSATLLPIEPGSIELPDGLPAGGGNPPVTNEDK